MIDDLAHLGLAIDSGPAATASKELDRLVQTSREAEDATDDLAVAAEAAGRGMEKAARETRGARAALEEAATAARKVEAAAVSVGRAAIAPTLAYVRAIEQVSAALRVQEQINRSTGVRSASDTAARAADIAALDGLRAKYNPLFAAARQYRDVIADIAQAAKVGAISEKERADAIERTTLVYQAQITQIRQLEGALKNQANAAKMAAESAVSRQTIAPNRAADISAYGAELDRLRERFSPLFAAAQRYESEIEDINRSLKVGAISQEEHTAALERAGAAYQSQIVQIKKLDAALAAQAATAKIAAQSMVSQQTITPDRGADVAAYGAELDRLRAKYNPLYAAGRQYRETLAEIAEAAKSGAISERERAAAVDRTKTAFAKQAVELNQVAKGAGLAGHQMMNLSRQANDVVTMMLMGATPIQIFTSQAGQIYQVLQEGQGGVTGSLKYLGERVIALVTPMRLATAGLVGLGIAAVAAYSTWLSSQKQLEAALHVGLGRATDATLADLNSIAEAASASGKVTVSEARSIAAAYVSTGKIGTENLNGLIDVTKNYAVVTGTDLAEASKFLAASFSDPEKAIADLDTRMNYLSKAARDYARDLLAQNKVSEAQQVLFREFKDSLPEATERLTKFGRGWQVVATWASNAWDAIGKAMSRMVDGHDATQAYADALKKSIANAQMLSSSSNPLVSMNAQWRITELQQELDRVQSLLEKERTRANTSRSEAAKKAADDIVRSMTPEIQQLEQLRARADKLRGVLAEAVLVGDPDGIRVVRTALESLRNTISGMSKDGTTLIPVEERLRKERELMLAVTRAQTPTARAAAEATLAEYRARTQGASEAEAAERKLGVVEQASAQILAQLTQAALERKRALDDQIEQAKLEVQLVGASAEERERLIANLKIEQELRAEAARNGTSVDQAQLDVLKQRNAEQAKQNQLLRDAKFISDATFERSQMGRTEGDQQIASTLRSSGRPVDLSSYEAGILRVNAALKDMKESASSALSGFATDLMNGVSAAKALANQLARIAEKLIQMAADQLVSQAFGGLLGAGGVGSLGTASTTSLFHTGGIVGRDATATRSVSPWAFAGAPRFHTGGLALDEFPAILQKGEEVLRRDDPRHILNGGQIRKPEEFVGGLRDMIATTIAPVMNIDARGSTMSPSELQAKIVPLLQQWRQEILQLIVPTVQQAKARRVRGL